MIYPAYLLRGWRFAYPRLTTAIVAVALIGFLEAPVPAQTEPIVFYDMTSLFGLDLNGSKLSPGDGASAESEKEIRLASEQGAHFLLFDLN